LTSTKMLRAASLLFALTMTAAACGSDSGTTAGDGTTTSAAGAGGSTTAKSGSSTSGAKAGDIKGDVVVTGSSTVEPISVAVAEDFKEIQPGVNVSVSGPGTGDGFKAFCVGDADISDASRKIKDEEAAACKAGGVDYLELKVGIDGIAVVTNTRNSAVACLSFPDLYALLGPESVGFKKWSDANALATTVKGTGGFPNADLVISAPGTESGTYDSFVELALKATADAQKQKPGARPDYSSAADDNVITETISSNPTSLGWVGFAYADQAEGLKLVPVSKDAGGECVEPTAETIAAGKYPLSRSLYIYVNTDKADKSPAVAAFVDHYMGFGIDKATAAADYIPLAADVAKASKAAWAGR
jgi:phosphate transport system substrate-binding protein